MTAEENMATARRYYDEVLNAGQLAVLNEIGAADYIENSPLPGQGTGLSGWEDRVNIVRGAFPDIHYTVEDMFGAGDRVAVRWRLAGTHTGPIMGIPPTGRPVQMGGIDIHRLAGGRLAEHWDQVDLLGFLQQIGAIPAPQG